MSDKITATTKIGKFEVNHLNVYESCSSRILWCSV